MQDELNELRERVQRLEEAAGLEYPVCNRCGKTYAQHQSGEGCGHYKTIE